MIKLSRAIAIFTLLGLLLGASLYSQGLGRTHRGTVRAADQPIPGATVTAVQGPVKLSAYTTENGEYSIDLGPGQWDLTVEMFGFPAQTKKVSGQEGSFLNWTLEMARPGATASQPASTQAPAAPGAGARGGRGGQFGQGRGGQAGQGRGGQFGQGRGGFGGGGRGPGRGPNGEPSTAQAPPSAGAPQPGATPAAQPAPAANGRGGRGGAQPGFQNATVRATEEGQQALNNQNVDAFAQAFGDINNLDTGDSFVVNGSTSGGLGAAADDEARRQQFLGGRGPGDFPGGFPPGGFPGGFNPADADAFGLGGFGLAALNGGFGGAGGGFDPGPGGFPGGPGGFDGGGGRGGPGGGRGGPGGGGRGGRGGGGGNFGGRGGDGRGGRGARGPGQFANIGNRQRRQPSYQGSVTLQFSNSALNAAPFSLNGQPTAKPSSNREQFGFNLGGPLVIPKLLNYRRANFTFTYSQTIARNGTNPVGSVPTAAMRSGDFSKLLDGSAALLFDPLTAGTRTPFPGAQIPATRINPASVALLSYFPNPLYDGLVQNYRLVSSTPNNNHNIGIRLNAPINNRDRINVNFQLQGRNANNQQLFGFRDATEGSGVSAQLGWSHSIGRRFNSNANVNFSRNSNTNAPFFAYGTNFAKQFGITGPSQDPINYGPPNLSFTNFSGLSDGSASISKNQTFNFGENITWVVKQKHNLQFGYTFQRIQQNSNNYQNARGTFSFSGLLTAQLDANGQPVAKSGYDFADFLLGFPQSSTLRYTSANTYLRSWSTNAFVQDDFRMSRKLTLNFGLRYEYFAPYTELNGHLANLDIKPGFTAASVVVSGQSGAYSGDLPSSLVRSQKRDFSPRFGFAYRPFQKDSTMIRGGYSIFYSGSPYAQIASQLSAQPPFATTSSISTSLANRLTLQNGFSTTSSQLTNTYAVNPNQRIGYTQQWNFGLQHNVTRTMFAELDYTGSKGTNNPVTEAPNQAPAGSSPLTAQQLLQIGNATGFTYLTYGSNSSYNAGQLRLTRRPVRGMGGNLQYTYAKAIDEATGGVQFVNNWHLERGLASNDRRHALQLNFQLSSPVGNNGMLKNSGWQKLLLQGWSSQGGLQLQSGQPFTAQLGGALANTGGIGVLGGSRAQATGSPVTGGTNPYFNLAAFTTPIPGQYGNAGRNTIPGPMQFTTNLSLNRSFRFGDSRRTVQLQLRAQNPLNHVYITRFGTTIGSSNYGLATAGAATRNVSLQLRFNF